MNQLQDTRLYLNLKKNLEDSLESLDKFGNDNYKQLSYLYNMKETILNLIHELHMEYQKKWKMNLSDMRIVTQIRLEDNKVYNMEALFENDQIIEEWII